MLDTPTEQIISRLKEALDVKTDGQMAKFLGISRQNIGAARKREDVPTGWIYKVAEVTGCSMDWLSFGKGPKIRVEYTTDDTSAAGRVASPGSSYGPRGVPDARSAIELQQDAKGSGFGAAVEMLARIYSSGDGARRFRHLETQLEEMEADPREMTIEELEELKKRLIALERQNPPE